MKLHIPSKLRSALMACFAAVAGFATTLSTGAIVGGVFAVAVGTVAQATDYTVEVSSGQLVCNDDDSTDITTPTSSDTITFNVTGGYIGGSSAKGSTTTISADIVITSLVLNNGWSGSASAPTITAFTGDVSGSGDFTRSSSQSYQYFTFSGDMSGYTGNISIEAATDQLTITNDSDSARTVNAASITVAGTTVFSGSSSTTVNSTVDTGTLTVSGDATFADTVEATTATVSGTANFNGETTITTLTVSSGGTATIGTSGSLTNSGTLTVSSGGTLTNAGTLTLSGTTTVAGTLTNSGDLTLDADGSLAVTGTLANSGTLTLNGTVTLSSAIANTGTVSFGSTAVIDLSNLTATESDGTYTYTLFTGDDVDLSGVSITGIETAGKEFSYNSDGTITYVITSNSLTWSGGALSWYEGATMDNGDFVTNDIVTFQSADADVTLTGDVTAAKVTINDGVTVSLTGGGNTLTVETFVLDGALELMDDCLEATSISGSGDIIFSCEGTVDYSDQLADFTGNATISTGCWYNYTEVTDFASITVEDGATLRLLSADYAGAVNVSGTGTSATAALRLNSSSITGDVTLTGDTTVVSEWDSAIRGAISGEGDLTVASSGTNILYLRGDIDLDGDLILTGGYTSFGSGDSESNTLSVNAITIESGATFTIDHASLDCSSIDINLNGGTIHAEDMDSGTGVSFGTLTLTADSSISYNWNGALTFDALTGDGNLAITVSSTESHETTFNAISNYNGTLSVGSGTHTLNVGSVHQDAGYDATISADLSNTNFSFTGEGSLTINGTLTVDGTLSLEAGTLSATAVVVNGTMDMTSSTDISGVTSFTLSDGAILSYDADSANSLFQVSSSMVAGSVTVDLLDVLDELSGGYNLGISSDVEESSISIAVLSDYTLSTADGYWYITSSGEVDTDWDLNWGAAGLADAPSSITEASELDASVELYENEDYANGIKVLSTADSATVSIYGGVNSDNDTTGGTIATDSWIKVSGGDIAVIVGGNYANNWGSGSVWNFTGDSHILVEDGTVQYIIGGNRKDGKAPTFDGDSYISIMGGDVTGSIIGGSTAAHNSTGTFSGDSSIWIYVPLATSTASSLDSGLSAGYVVGGCATTANSASKVAQTGDSSVTVDLSDYQGDTSTFSKIIVGGAYLYGTGAVSATQTGDTYITIDGTTADDTEVTFSSAIVGWSYAVSSTSSTSTLNGGTNITIDSGTFTANIVGGARIYGATSTITGTTSITLNGGTSTASVIGGSWAAAGNTTSSIGDVEITVNGGTWATIIGGSNIEGGGTATLSDTTGDITITVNDGSVGTIYGGSYSVRGNSSSTSNSSSHGAITINLLGGSLTGSVYAGGSSTNSSGNTPAGVTAESTTVQLSSAVTITSGVTISGAGNGDTCSVTGDRTLDLSSEDGYSNLGGVLFTYFDTVNAASAATLASLTTDGDTFTKTGAGALTVSGGSLTATSLVVSGGSLDLSGATTSGLLTSISVAAGSSLKTGAVAMASDMDLALDLAGAVADSDAIVSVGTMTRNGSINLSLSNYADLDIGTYTLLTWTSGTLDLTAIDGFDDSDPLLQLSIDGTSLVLTVGDENAWIWAGDSSGNGTWTADSYTQWKDKSDDNPEGKDIYFTNISGVDEATVTISGTVNPESVTMSASSTAYVFTGTGSVNTPTLTVKSGASLTLENSGNVFTSAAVAGTLTLAVDGAISGTTISLSGELVVSAETALYVDDVDVVFNGGSVHFTVESLASLDAFSAGTSGAVIEVDEGVEVTLFNSDGQTALDKGLTLEGAGTLVLDGNGSTLELASGTTVSVGEDATLLFNGAGEATVAATLSGAGTVTVTNTGGSNATTFSADNSGFTGDLYLTASPASSWVGAIFSATNSMGSGTVYLNGLAFASGASVTQSAAIVVAADTTQEETVSGVTTTYTGAVTGSGTWTLDGSQTNVLSGDVSGFTGALAATDDATWRLTGSTSIQADLTGSGLYVIASGSAATLSGAVTDSASLRQSGSGALTLTRANTTSGELTIDSGCTVYLGTADSSATWAGATISGSGALVLVNGELTGSSVSSTATISVDVAAGGVVDLGGNAGSLVTGDLTVNEGGSLTNVGGSITEAQTVTLVIGSSNISGGSAASSYLISFTDTSSTLTLDAGDSLELDIDDVVATIKELKDSSDVYLTLTNGQLALASEDASWEDVVFTEGGTVVNILSSLGVRVTGVEGGSIVLSGEASGVYFAADGYEATAVTGYQWFSAYQAVAVDTGESLTLTLDGAPDTGDDDGALVNNLIGGTGSTFSVVNSQEGATALVTLNNEDQTIDEETGYLPEDPEPMDTTFAGDIDGTSGAGDVEFVKTGAGTLTVTGSFTAAALTLEAGAVAVGEGSDFDTVTLSGGDLTINGDTSMGTLTTALAAGESATVEIADDATLTVDVGGTLESTSLSGGALVLTSGAALSLGSGSSISGTAVSVESGTTLDLGDTTNEVTSLSGSGTVSGSGASLTVTEGGTSFGGSLSGTGTNTLTVASGASQTFTSSFSADSSWDLVNNGSVTFDLEGSGSNSSVTLGHVTLGDNSSTTILFNSDYDTGSASLLNLTSLSVSDSASIAITSSGNDTIVTSGGSYVIGTVSDVDASDVGTYSLTLTGTSAFMLVNTAASSISITSDGEIVLNLVTAEENSLAQVADNQNSHTGAELLWSAASAGTATTGTDKKAVLDAVNTAIDAGDTAEANRLMAAMAGSGIATLSSAFAGDVDRQLRAIRNRTTSMGVNPCVVNEDMPYFNAWINAEGDYRKVDADGWLPGYELTSWGGTVGFDVDFNEHVTAGLALTAMYGDLDTDSADKATGDLDTYYVSLFARMSHHRWTHTVVGTIGRMDGNLKRTVDYGSGRYKTDGDTDGTGFGLLYEVGYTVPLNEDATACLQPVANVAWRHVNVGSYTEEGSDAALHAGSQTYNVVTFGLGARAQALVGENTYNRSSLLEARALLKLDAGDREGEATVAMVEGGSAAGKVKSSEIGAFGVEVGAGLSIPIEEAAGSIFIDASLDLRNNYTSVNGVIGYRINF